jgi:hypothetical protein
VFYSTVGAIFSFFLHPSPGAIRSNALTENLQACSGLHCALLGVWERFDTLWYVRIAEHGYDLPMGVIFYPAYPAAIRLVSVIIPPLAASLVVSTVAAFFFLWGLLRLAEPDLAQRGRMRMLLLVCAWPAAFVLFAGYAESMTLALIVWAIAFAREQRWLTAALCGMIAGAARPSGVLVALPLFLLAWRNRQLRSLWVLLSPLGWLSYWLWLRSTGRPSVVEAYRIYQGHVFGPPWAGLAETLRLIALGHDTVVAMKLAMVTLILTFALRSQVATAVQLPAPTATGPRLSGALSRLQVRAEDKVFVAAVVLQMFMYTGRPLLGAPRFLLLAYPAFVMLGNYADRQWPRARFWAVLAASACLNLAWLWAFLNWSLIF